MMCITGVMISVKEDISDNLVQLGANPFTAGQSSDDCRHQILKIIFNINIIYFYYYLLNIAI